MNLAQRLITEFIEQLPGHITLQQWCDDLCWWIGKPDDSDDLRLDPVDGDDVDEIVNWQLQQLKAGERR